MSITDIDISILLFIQEHIRKEWLTVIMKAITFLGDLGWFWILLGILLVFPKKTRNIGFVVLFSLLIDILVNNVALKNIIARTRPYDFTDAIIPLIPKPHDFSFPSGHTAASFASAFVCYRMAPKKYGIAALVLAALIGLSRLYLGVHYPSDVIGGFFVGLLSSIAAYYILKPHLKENCQADRKNC